jgi:hypothetical protein
MVPNFITLGFLLKRHLYVVDAHELWGLDAAVAT